MCLYDDIDRSIKEKRNSQALPPGTHRPAAPEALVQASCFSFVLAIQHEPLGAGRPEFCPTEAAEVRAAKARMIVAMENCILFFWVESKFC